MFEAIVSIYSQVNTGDVSHSAAVLPGLLQRCKEGAAISHIDANAGVANYITSYQQVLT